MNLIFEGEIIQPPTESSSLYSLLLYINCFSKNVEDILIEAPRSEWDFYWKYIKYFHINDFINDFIEEKDNVTGVRISNQFKYAPTIYVERIVVENVKYLYYLINRS